MYWFNSAFVSPSWWTESLLQFHVLLIWDKMSPSIYGSCLMTEGPALAYTVFDDRQVAGVHWMDKKEMKMSETMKSTKQAGVIALIGAVTGIGVSVLLNAAYSSTPDGAGLTVPPWQPALEQIAAPALTFAPAIDVYHFYGRLVFLVLAAFTVSVFLLSANQRADFNEKPSRIQTWGFRLAMTGLVLTVVGNLGDYWVSVGEIIDLVAFVGGTVLGLLLLAIGLVLFGVAGLRSASLPKPAAWALMLWFPFTFLLFLVGMANLPAAPLLSLSLAWGITGISIVGSGVEERALRNQTT
jgi:hypothetical protein